MAKIGVVAGDSRDPLGRGRFFPLQPKGFLIPGDIPSDSWYWRYIYYQHEEVIYIYIYSLTTRRRGFLQLFFTKAFLYNFEPCINFRV